MGKGMAPLKTGGVIFDVEDELRARIAALEAALRDVVRCFDHKNCGCNMCLVIGKAEEVLNG